MDWARILAFVTGSVDQELLARAEYLAAENRILKAQLKGRPKLSDAERATLAEIGHRLGRKVLAEVATVARPDTIQAWYRKLVRWSRPFTIGGLSIGRLRVQKLPHQPEGRLAISPRLNQNVQHFTFGIHSAPNVERASSSRGCPVA